MINKPSFTGCRGKLTPRPGCVLSLAPYSALVMWGVTCMIRRAGPSITSLKNAGLWHNSRASPGWTGHGGGAAAGPRGSPVWTEVAEVTSQKAMERLLDCFIYANTKCYRNGYSAAPSRIMYATPSCVLLPPRIPLESTFEHLRFTKRHLDRHVRGISEGRL